MCSCESFKAAELPFLVWLTHLRGRRVCHSGRDALLTLSLHT